MKWLLFCVVLLTSCTRQVYVQSGELISVGTTKIEKVPHGDGQVFFLHFNKEVDYRDFDATIPGVTVIQQNDKYSLLVRVGFAFDQVEVLKQVIKSNTIQYE